MGEYAVGRGAVGPSNGISFALPDSIDKTKALGTMREQGAAWGIGRTDWGISMLRSTMAWLALGLTTTVVLAPAPALSADVIESYVARLSEDDHYNSNGQRLTSAAAIIRQDRANYHRFGNRDGEDEGDAFFNSQENRALMERLLERGRMPASLRNQIVNGTPLIRVEVIASDNGDYVAVSLE